MKRFGTAGLKRNLVFGWGLTILMISALAIGLDSCQKSTRMSNRASAVSEEIFGKTPDGRVVKIFTLSNKNGLRARVTEYGAILVSMETPDLSGKTADIGEHPAPMGFGNNGFDTRNKKIALVDIDTGVAVFGG